MVPRLLQREPRQETMRIVKATLVVILFLLIPHQAPSAGPSEGDGQTVLGATAGPALAPEAGDPSPVPPRRARREAMRSNQGFVWSVASSPSPGAAWSSGSGHLESDGYSWSVHSPGSQYPVDPVR